VPAHGSGGGFRIAAGDGGDNVAVAFKDVAAVVGPIWQAGAHPFKIRANHIREVMLERHLTVPWVKSLFGSQEYTKLLLPWESAAAYAESYIRRPRAVGAAPEAEAGSP
jgi:hypothetical protein